MVCVQRSIWYACRGLYGMRAEEYIDIYMVWVQRTPVYGHTVFGGGRAGRNVGQAGFAHGFPVGRLWGRQSLLFLPHHPLTSYIPPPLTTLTYHIPPPLPCQADPSKSTSCSTPAACPAPFGPARDSEPWLRHVSAELTPSQAARLAAASSSAASGTARFRVVEQAEHKVRGGRGWGTARFRVLEQVEHKVRGGRGGGWPGSGWWSRRSTR